MLKKTIIVTLVILAGFSCLLSDLLSLGMIGDWFLYFYKGNFVLCSSECFLKNGQLMYYYNKWSGIGYAHINVFFIVGAIVAVMAVLSFIGKTAKKVFRKK